MSTSLSLDVIVRGADGDRPVLEPLDVPPGSTQASGYNGGAVRVQC